MAIMPEDFWVRCNQTIPGLVSGSRSEFSNITGILEEFGRRTGRKHDNLARGLGIDGCRFLFETVDELPRTPQQTVIAKVWIHLDRDPAARRKVEGFSPTSDWLWHVVNARRCLLDNLLNHRVFMSHPDFCGTCAEQIRKVLQLDLDQVAEKIRSGQKIY